MYRDDKIQRKFECNPHINNISHLVLIVLYFSKEKYE